MLAIYASVLLLHLLSGCIEQENKEFDQIAHRLSGFCAIVRCGEANLSLVNVIGDKDRIAVSISDPIYPLKNTIESRFANAVAYGIMTEFINSESTDSNIVMIDLDMIHSGSVTPFEYSIGDLKKYDPFVESSVILLKLIGNRDWASLRQMLPHSTDSEVDNSEELVVVLESAFEACGNYTEYDFYQLGLTREKAVVQFSLRRSSLSEFLEITFERDSGKVESVDVSMSCDLN